MIDNKNIVNHFLIAVLPLPFTTLGVNLLTIYGFYIPEVFFVAWTVLASILNKRVLIFLKATFFSRRFLTAMLLILIVTFTSAYRYDFDLQSYYGRIRSLSFFIFSYFSFFVLSKKCNKEDFFYFLSVFTISACLMYLTATIVFIKDESHKTSVSMVLFSLSSLILIEQRKIFLALIISMLSIVVAYLSFFRQNYISSIMLFSSVLIMLASKLIITRKGSGLLNKQSIFGFLSIIIFLYSITINMDRLLEFLTKTESRQIQSIEKIFDLLNFFNTGVPDDSGKSRLRDLFYLADNFIYYLLPNGLIDDSLLYVYSIWGGKTYYPGISITRDSILAYMAISFGLILSFVFVSSYIFILSNSFFRFKGQAFRRFFILGPSVFFSILVDGATLTQLHKSFFFGMALAMLVSLSKEKIIHD